MRGEGPGGAGRLAAGPAGSGGERGSSVVIAVVALPLLLAFLFAVIDLGRVAFLGAEASTAAHAVCRFVAARPEAAASPDDLRQAALAASPSLAADGLDLRVSVQVGEVREHGYQHRRYDGQSGSFVELEASARTRPVEVALAVEGGYLTPVGEWIARAGGAPDATFACRAQASRSLGASAEGGAP